MKFIMKSFIMTFLFFIFVAINGAAQRNDGTTMQDIIETGSKLIKYFEEQKEKEVVRVEYDIIVTEKESFRNLTSDWTYTIAAFGDDRIEDIDVEVFRRTSSGSWVSVAKDNDASDVAVVNVKPSVSGMYKIVTKAYKFKDGYTAAHYGLIILHE